jgi:hypothetical protein
MKRAKKNKLKNIFSRFLLRWLKKKKRKEKTATLPRAKAQVLAKM